MPPRMACGCCPAFALDRLPRMADFALWATACETALWPAGTFARAYAANRRAAIEDVIEADPVAACVREIMAERSSWTGSAADFCVSAPTAADDGEFEATPPAGPEIRARSPAACGARRRPCGRWASRSPSAVRAAPAAGSSGCARPPKVPSSTVSSVRADGSGLAGSAARPAGWRRAGCSVRLDDAQADDATRRSYARPPFGRDRCSRIRFSLRLTEPMTRTGLRSRQPRKARVDAFT